jgi:iron complex transport system ATP-binding protein
MTPLIETRQLTFSYAAAPAVLQGIDLICETASMLAVIGANGSGKSTLIRLLVGLLRPTSGDVLLHGVSLRRWEARQRAQQIAYVPQLVNMAFPFRAIDVVLSGRTPYLGRFEFETAGDEEKARQALAEVDAAHLADRAFTSLSGGERQMVILARALAQEAKLLLLDEPSAALDLKHRASLIRTLVRLRETRQIAVVMVTHDLQLTGIYFDRILALRCGRVAEFGSPEEVLTSDRLCAIYDDPGIRTQRIGGQTVVWVEQ